MSGEPDIYKAIEWWKTNIGFTNPGWNLLFYKIYSYWICNGSPDVSSIIKPDSLGSEFINEYNLIILNYCKDFVEETEFSKWAYDLSFVLTCFYFLDPYHEYYSQHLRFSK